MAFFFYLFLFSLCPDCFFFFCKHLYPTFSTLWWVIQNILIKDIKEGAKIVDVSRPLQSAIFLYKVEVSHNGNFMLLCKGIRLCNFVDQNDYGIETLLLPLVKYCIKSQPCWIFYHEHFAILQFLCVNQDFILTRTNRVFRFFIIALQKGSLKHVVHSSTFISELLSNIIGPTQFSKNLIRSSPIITYQIITNHTQA